MTKFFKTLKEIVSVIKIILLFLIFPVYAGYVQLIDYLLDQFALKALNLPAQVYGFDTLLLLKIALYPLLGIYIVFSIWRWSKKQKEQREEFMRVSRVTDATILQATQSGMRGSRQYALLQLKVHGTPEFETYVEIPINLLAVPKVGDTIRVRYNPSNHDQLELADGTHTLTGEVVQTRLEMLKKLRKE